MLEKYRLDFLILFLGTLVGYSKVLGLLPLIFFVYVLVVEKGTIRRGDVYRTFFAIFVILFYSFLAVAFPDHFLQLERDRSLLLSKTFFYMSMIISILGMWLYFRNKKERLFELIKCLLWMHLFFFYLQMLVFYSFSINLDFIGYFTGVSNRTQLGGYYRLTGIFLEPSTYAYFIMALLVSAVFLGKVRLSLVLITLASMALTFSTAAFLSLTVFSLIYFQGALRRGLRNPFILFALPILASVLWYSAQFQLERFGGGDEVAVANTVGMRMMLVENVVTRDPSTAIFWFGNGLISYESIVYEMQRAALRIAAVDDATIFVTLIFRFGVFGLFAIFFSFAHFRGVRGKLMIVPVFLSKITFFDLIFWLPFLCWSVSKVKENDDENTQVDLTILSQSSARFRHHIKWR